jgi:hypothetical protein
MRGLVALFKPGDKPRFNPVVRTKSLTPFKNCFEIVGVVTLSLTMVSTDA